MREESYFLAVEYNWDTSFIEKEQPDVVIDEVLERCFNTRDPVELQAMDPSETAASYK